MTQIVPGVPPLENMPLQPGASSSGSDSPSFADWLRAAATARRTLPEDFTSDGAAVALPDTAKIFNEDGFFTGSPQRVAEPTKIPTIAELRSGGGDAALASPDLNLSLEAAPVLPATSPIVSRHGFGSPATSPGLYPLPRALNPISTPSPPRGQATEAAPEPEMQPEAPVEGPAPRLPPPAAQARSALRIAIRDLERGLQIIVAANALDTQERERLANEIAGLLSRYGLLPGDVRVTGVTKGPTTRGNG